MASVIFSESYLGMSGIEVKYIKQYNLNKQLNDKVVSFIQNKEMWTF